MSSTTKAVSASARLPDLKQADWLDAGQKLLRRGGLRALKLRPLAEELRVSTGSFYHHFPDFDAYQGRLAEYFADDQVRAGLEAITRAATDPIDRIRLLGQSVRRSGASRLSIAMRAWAESDARAREAVEKHDAIMLDFLGDCLTDAGFSQHEADLRAYALMTLGLSKVHAPHLDIATLFDKMIGILCVPTAAVKRGCAA